MSIEGEIQAHWAIETRFYIITSVQYITMEDETVITIIIIIIISYYNYYHS